MLSLSWPHLLHFFPIFTTNFTTTYAPSYNPCFDNGYTQFFDPFIVNSTTITTPSPTPISATATTHHCYPHTNQYALHYDFLHFQDSIKSFMASFDCYNEFFFLEAIHTIQSRLRSSETLEFIPPSESPLVTASAPLFFKPTENGDGDVETEQVGLNSSAIIATAPVFSTPTVISANIAEANDVSFSTTTFSHDLARSLAAAAAPRLLVAVSAIRFFGLKFDLPFIFFAPDLRSFESETSASPTSMPLPNNTTVNVVTTIAAEPPLHSIFVFHPGDIFTNGFPTVACRLLRDRIFQTVLSLLSRYVAVPAPSSPSPFRASSPWELQFSSVRSSSPMIAPFPGMVPSHGPASGWPWVPWRLELCIT